MDYNNRDIQKLADNLKAEMVDLQLQKETIQTEKLKGTATTAATNIAENIGSLFGSNKVKTLERENTAQHREVFRPRGNHRSPAR